MRPSENVFIILNMKQNRPIFIKFLDMLFEIMLFLIKAEVGTFEGNQPSGERESENSLGK